MAAVFAAVYGFFFVLAVELQLELGWTPLRSTVAARLLVGR